MSRSYFVALAGFLSLTLVAGCGGSSEPAAAAKASSTAGAQQNPPASAKSDSNSKSTSKAKANNAAREVYEDSHDARDRNRKNN